MRTLGVVCGLVLAGVVAAGCGGETAPRRPTEGMHWPRRNPLEDHFPQVINARAVPVGRGRYDVTVTISSPYDSRFRFANGWRVLTAEGNLLGERRFVRDHALEQPWTRTLRGVRIPDEVRGIVIEGHDVRYGFGGRPAFLSLR